MTLDEYRGLSALAVEWAFYGLHTSNVYPKGYGSAPPEDEQVGGVDKAEYGYRLFEDALIWVERKDGRVIANVARESLRKWYADGVEPLKGTNTRLHTLRAMVKAHEIHLERQKVFAEAA